MLDGFPIDNLSLVHFVLFDASLKPEVMTMSELLVWAQMIAAISETNGQIHEALEVMDTKKEGNTLLRDKGFTRADGKKEHIDFWLALDKKGSK